MGVDFIYLEDQEVGWLRIPYIQAEHMARSSTRTQIIA